MAVDLEMVHERQTNNTHSEQLLVNSSVPLLRYPLKWKCEAFVDKKICCLTSLVEHEGFIARKRYFHIVTTYKLITL